MCRSPLLSSLWIGYLPANPGLVSRVIIALGGGGRNRGYFYHRRFARSARSFSFSSSVWFVVLRAGRRRLPLNTAEVWKLTGRAAAAGGRVRWRRAVSKGEAGRCGVAVAIGRFLRPASPLQPLTVVIIDGRRPAWAERDCARPCGRPMAGGQPCPWFCPIPVCMFRRHGRSRYGCGGGPGAAVFSNQDIFTTETPRARSFSFFPPL